MEPSIIIFLAAALIIGAGILAIIGLTRRSGKTLNRQKYQSEWLKIEQGLVADEPATAELAIIKADKLVDLALRERGFQGATMGERMKNAQATWKSADQLWGVHKLRNRIAHEQSVQVNYQTAKRALPAYRQALKDLGAI